jgi:hypothetical protein
MDTKRAIGLAILMGAALLWWSTLPGLAMVGAGGPVGFQGQAPIGFEGNPPVGFEEHHTFKGNPGFHRQRDFGCQGTKKHHPYAKECHGGWSHE